MQRAAAEPRRNQARKCLHLRGPKDARMYVVPGDADRQPIVRIHPAFHPTSPRASTHGRCAVVSPVLLHRSAPRTPPNCRHYRQAHRIERRQCLGCSACCRQCECIAATAARHRHDRGRELPLGCAERS
eukprot:5429277-Prymnesium_polylepis.1